MMCNTLLKNHKITLGGGIVSFVYASMPCFATLISINSADLLNPTFADLQSGITINDYAGYTGLTVTVTASGNHESGSTGVVGSAFSATLPSANSSSSASYSFTFSGGSSWDVVGLDITTNNNLYSRNLSGTGFQIRERASFDVTGGTWDSIIPNVVDNTDQLQINGVGNTNGSVGIALPTQAQVAFDTSGFVASSSGSITAASYTYDHQVVTNGGSAPSGLAINQPFFIDIDVVAIPEPSSSALLGLAGIGSILRRKR